MTTFTVNSAGELYTALNSAAAGDTISLGAGNYGQLNLSNYQFSDYITIASANGGSNVVIEGVDLNNSSHIRFDDVTFDNTYRIQIRSSDHIEIKNSEINRPIDIGYSDSITIQDSNIYQMSIVKENNSNIKFIGNYLDVASSDAMQVTNVTGMLIENNEFAGNNPGPTSHADFIQFLDKFGTNIPSSDVVIRGNFFHENENPREIQAIFIEDALPGGYQNFVIENNIIYSASVHGIRFQLFI